jgi:signal peptidase I
MDAELPIARTNSIATERPLGASISKARRGSASWLKQVFQALVAAGLALASYYFISHYLVQSVQVVGNSMVPTLHNSEHYLLNRWVYNFKKPQRSDVVVIRDPAAGCFSVKRIIGIEGDSVYLKDGFVFLNGQKLNEPYLLAKTPTFAIGHTKEQLIMCGKDQFFLLGDNRMNSADSRVYGPVPRRNIIGMLVN